MSREEHPLQTNQPRGDAPPLASFSSVPAPGSERRDTYSDIPVRDCPSEETIVGFSLGVVPDKTRSLVDGHLTICSSCRVEVAALRAALATPPGAAEILMSVDCKILQISDD
jgi:hypothetical protein